jgi:hypothetical protein
MSIDWNMEWPLIQGAAVAYGVNAFLLAAMRRQENGAPGYEYGVPSRIAADFHAQLRVACITVAHRMDGWSGVMYKRVGHVAVMSDEWIRLFASIWAPVGAANDPDGLNVSWPANVIALQKLYAETGRPGTKMAFVADDA